MTDVLPIDDYFKQAVATAGDVPGLPEGTMARPVEHVGVIGAGTMGGGISMNMANVGIPVTIVETSAEALERGLGVIRANYERSARKGRITDEDVETRCALITGSLELDDLAACDMVIEAVFENMEVKQDIFRRLDAIAKPGAILASNTSALNLNEIAAVTSRPEDVIGMHFFSPANVMKLLEVVRGEKTAADVIRTAMDFGRHINKIAVLVGVCHGFVGNRMLFTRQAQAQQLLLAGVAPHRIDQLLCDFGMPMGPFQMSDLAGLDIGWKRETSRGESIRDRLCEIDRRGQKTKAGYYDYDENRVPTPSPVVDKIIADFISESGLPQREVSDEEILQRCLYPMINEGARILEEGMASRASDIDVVWVFGYGWPANTGGPMRYADDVGLQNVVDSLRAFQAADGDDAFWEPSPLLLQLAGSGGSFTAG